MNSRTTVTAAFLVVLSFGLRGDGCGDKGSDDTGGGGAPSGTTGSTTGTTGTGTGVATGTATGTGTGAATFLLTDASSWTGSQTYSFASSQPQPDQFNCVLAFDAAGTATQPVPPECASCLFVFDLAFTYDAAASTDDGTCAAIGLDQQTGATYGVRDDGGNLTLLLKDYAGNFFDYGTATHDGFGNLTFEGGQLNEPFGTSYNSGYWQGTATLTAR